MFDKVRFQECLEGKTYKNVGLASILKKLEVNSQTHEKPVNTIRYEFHM